MHFSFFLSLLAVSPLIQALPQAFAEAEATPEAYGLPSLQSYANDRQRNQKRELLLRAIERLEARADAIEATHLARRDAIPEAYPQPQLLGAVLRGAGKALTKAGDKAGGKVAKEQGKNAGQDKDKGLLQKTADRMYTNLKKTNSYVNKKCIEGLVNSFSVAGGYNGNIGCMNDPKKTPITAKGK